MIELSFNTAFMLYLGLTLIALLGLWGWHHYIDRKRTIVSCRQKVVICEYCKFVFLDRSLNSINQCPECHSYTQNE